MALPVALSVAFLMALSKALMALPSVALPDPDMMNPMMLENRCRRHCRRCCQQHFPRPIIERLEELCIGRMVRVETLEVDGGEGDT